MFGTEQCLNTDTRLRDKASSDNPVRQSSDSSTVGFETHTQAQNEAGLRGEKLVRLLDGNLALKRAWKLEGRTKRELKATDRDLADAASAAGWSDQEIWDLITAHWRNSGDTTQPDADHIESIVRKAGSSRARSLAIARISEINHRIGRDTQVNEELRSELVKLVSDVVGAKIIQVVRYLGDPPSYYVKFRDTSISVPKVDGILRCKLFEQAVASCCGVVMPSISPSNWRIIAQAIIFAAVDQDLGTESDPKEIIAEGVSAYLGAFKPQHADHRHKAIEQRRPFMCAEGELEWVYFFLPEFAQFLNRRRYGLKIPNRKVATMLRCAGALPCPVYLPSDHPKGSTVHAWKWRRQ